MFDIEDCKGYKRLAIWINECPIVYGASKTMGFSILHSSCEWNEGIVCVEAKLNPRHASNYGMLCMKYTRWERDYTNIIINYDNEVLKKNTRLFNGEAVEGLNHEFADVIRSLIEDAFAKKMPRGIVEVLCGAYDQVGSSEVSFKKTLEIALNIYCNDAMIFDSDYESESESLLKDIFDSI